MGSKPRLTIHLFCGCLIIALLLTRKDAKTLIALQYLALGKMRVDEPRFQ